MRLALGILIAASSTALADLKFERRMTNYTAKAEEEKFTAVFKFTNNGKAPVEVKKVDSSCGCLKAESNKTVYKSGEAGTITAVYSLGSFEGTQNKTMTVVYAEAVKAAPPVEAAPSTPAPAAVATEVGAAENPENAVDDPNAAEATPAVPAAPTEPKSETLTVVVTVPTVLEINPKFTKWKQGDAPEPKTVQLEVKHDKPIRVKEVRSTRDNMQLQLKTVEDGKRYELVLTPKSTAEAQLGLLTIITDSDMPKHERKLAYYSIERQNPPAAVK